MPCPYPCHVAVRLTSLGSSLLRLTFRELIRASLYSTRSEGNQLFCRRWRQSNVWGNGAEGGRRPRGGGAEGRRGEGARKIGGVTEGMGDYLPRFGSADGAQAHASRLSASRCAATPSAQPGNDFRAKFWRGWGENTGKNHRKRGRQVEETTGAYSTLDRQVPRSTRETITSSPRGFNIPILPTPSAPGLL